MDELVSDGPSLPAPHVRALFVVRDAAQAARWAKAARPFISLTVTAMTALDAVRDALELRRFDLVVAAPDVPGAPLRDVLAETVGRGEELSSIVVGDFAPDEVGALVGLGAFDIVRPAELDRLGPAMGRALRIATLSRALRHAREELQARRATGIDRGLRSLLDQVPALVWTTDANLNVTAIHGAPDGVTIEEDRFVGRRIGTSDAFSSHEDRSVTLYAHRQALAGELARYEIVWGGRERQAQVEALYDDAGETIGTIGVMFDVAESTSDRRIAHLTSHDVLTDLPTRALFESRLESAIAASQPGDSTAVIFLDLDRFMAVNELLSHAGGDEVIRTIAARLRRMIGEHDLVSRFGGDSFVVLLAEATRERAFAMAESLIAIVRPVITLDDREIALTASAGVSTFPADGSDAAALITNAEAAMYEAKGMGRNMVRAHAPSTPASSSERLMLQRDLLLAIERSELELFYQPMYGVATQAITGVEALLRWVHPVHGMVMPDRFIPIAEECGAIDAIGDWVVGRACEQIRAWTDAGIPNVRVSVNVSARQFEQHDLLDRVYAHVQRCMIPPGALEIEVTETSIMRDMPSAIRALCELKELGVRVSIDDFGTGYTSLRFLKRFPVDVLKIDRSFVRDVATGVFDGAIVRAVTTLARSLGVVTIAEGVELQAQFDRLRDLECDEVQGFLFSQPMRADDCTPLLMGAILPV